MSKGSPSMIALLGLMAVAGYQNRDKLSGMLKGAGGQGSGLAGNATGGDDMIGNLTRMFTGGGAGAGMGGLAGGSIAGGLNELLGRFSNPVHQAKAKTWVDTGPNSAIDPQDLEGVLDEETLSDLGQQTGLSRSELLARLSKALPDAVDQFTPQGRIPTDEEARSFF